MTRSPDIFDVTERTPPVAPEGYFIRVSKNHAVGKIMHMTNRTYNVELRKKRLIGSVGLYIQHTDALTMINISNMAARVIAEHEHEQTRKRVLREQVQREKDLLGPYPPKEFK